MASKTDTFKPLTHLIPGDEQRECGFYAVWNQMPDYCRYCHEEDHVIANCPKRKTRHTCWNCGAVGHIATEYSRDKPSKKARKQLEPLNKRFDTVKSHNAPPEVMPNDICTPDEVSEELMEDLVEPDAQNNMSEPPDTTVAVDVPAPTLNAETASKHNVKRTILTKVTHPHNAFAPFYVLVIYAPATTGQHRSQFFDQLFDLLHSPTLDINLDRLVITGDFNYSYQRPHLSSQTSLQWVSFLDDHFYNALQKDDLHELPTFRCNDNIFSTIDYIFVSQSWCSNVTESNIHKLDASWSDHSLLSITCCIGSSPSGPGLWRGNPLLARNPAYQQYLRQHLEDILPKLPSEWSAAKSWDHIKRQVKKITRTFAVDYTNWRIKTIRKLQSNRNKVLRSKPPLAIRLHPLPIFDQQIASLQQEFTDILALKANVRCPLYDADPVDDLQLDSYLQGISDLPQVTSDYCDILMAPITIDEIIQETARVKNKISSPGEDGLGYAFLYQLFRYPPLQKLVLKVCNQAHNSSIFPHSWQELRSSQLTNAAGDTIPDQPMSNWVYAESLYRGKWSRA
ncbi:hypothetical protein G6F46_005989 [Rhizopus delemar]|nr:hypothetical protein G6F52_009294 [Rhizopus delemar]KAG1544432.1 hypothetical protein G6F51_006059 [Rhizopus arrhizus]KAG1541390.1 hypothetical protein G6F49_011898 [Rhizopus delemar]KAG1570293.1 hypothetical protein G6F50_005620 [Rhizopus delemar]KAG1603721.1 hypothetical protein G6F47_001565 [Rhizopus delemar]